MTQAVYTFVGNANSRYRVGEIDSVQGKISLGQSGLLTTQEVADAQEIGLTLELGPAQSPASGLTAPSAATGPTGILTGVYHYAVTFVTAVGETQVGPSVSVTLATQEASITNIPVGSAVSGVLSRKLYRTTAGGSTLRLVGAIADNTTTTAVDNLADGSLGATAPSSDTSFNNTGVTPALARDTLYAQISGDPDDDGFAISAGTGTKVPISGSGAIAGLNASGLLTQKGQMQALVPVLEPHKRTQFSANAVVAANAAAALTIVTPDASGQVVEPAIEYVGSGWNGHKFWGLITGYTNGSSATENPALYFSDDGQTWTQATGVPFPVVPQPSGGNNYDPEIVLGPDGNLHGFWCSSVLSGGVTTCHLWWTVFSPGTSGAVNMTTPVDILTTAQLTEAPVGPAFRWDGANNQWQVWYTDTSSFYNGGSGVYPSFYRTIAGPSPGGVMSVRTSVTVNGIPGGLSPFERHISDYGDQLHMVVTLCTAHTGGGSTTLYFGVSNDNGLTWQLSSSPLLTPSASGWDNGQIYRGDIIPISDGAGTVFGLWYSADNASSVWKMGYTTITTLGSLPATVLKASAHYDLGTDASLNMAIGSTYSAIVGGSGKFNIAIGGSALTAVTTGQANAAIGASALLANTTGSNNVAVGGNALQLNVSGASNVAVGVSALHAATGSNNTAIGFGAAQTLTSGTSNVAIGQNAMNLATTAGNATIVGRAAMSSLTTGADNTAVGFGSGQAPAGTSANATITGAQNTFVGSGSGAKNATDPSHTVAVGYNAVVGGSWATALGMGTSAGAAGSVAIGADHTGAAAATTTQDQIVLGTALHAVSIPGVLFPQQQPTASEPTYVKGGMYFDTTLNKLRIGGATAWETVTSS